METKTSKGKEIKIPGLDHPITILPAEGKVRVTVAGRIVAESAQALRLDEKGNSLSIGMSFRMRPRKSSRKVARPFSERRSRPTLEKEQVSTGRLTNA